VNHLICGRVINAILLFFLIIMYMFFVLTNLAQQYNPFTVTLFYYSLWGACLALLSMIFSIIAIRRESWFRVAYISVEISYAANTTILWVFWLILWPNMLKMFDAVVEKASPADKESMKATM